MINKLVDEAIEGMYSGSERDFVLYAGAIMGYYMAGLIPYRAAVAILDAAQTSENSFRGRDVCPPPKLLSRVFGRSKSNIRNIFNICPTYGGYQSF